MNLVSKRLPDPEAAIFIRAQDAGRFRFRYVRLGSILAYDGLAVAPTSDEDLRREAQSLNSMLRCITDLIITILRQFYGRRRHTVEDHTSQTPIGSAARKRISATTRASCIIKIAHAGRCETKSHLVHRIPLLRSRGKCDVSIIRRFYPELNLSSRHGVEMVFQFVLGVKR